MQTVLASSLRNGVGINIGPGIARLAHLKIHSIHSSSCFDSGRQPRLTSAFSSDTILTAYRRHHVTPRARLIRTFGTHPEVSPPPSASTPAPTSTTAVHSTDEPASLSTTSQNTQLPPSKMNGANTSPRAKRKPSPFEMIESGRPSKKFLRSSMNNGRQSAGDNTPDVEAADLEMDDEYIDEAALQVLPSLGPDTAEWQVTPPSNHLGRVLIGKKVAPEYYSSHASKAQYCVLAPCVFCTNADS